MQLTRIDVGSSGSSFGLSALRVQSSGGAESRSQELGIDPHSSSISFVQSQTFWGGAQLHTPFLTLELRNSSVSFQQFLWWATACLEHG